MKKLCVLVLAVVLVLSLASFADAAVTVGGELRTWYESTHTASQDLNTFKLDRLNLDVNADITPTMGFKSEIMILGVGKNDATVTGSASATPDDNGNYPFSTTATSTLQVDFGYYYQQNVIFTGDEVDFGVFGYANALPFKNGYGYGKWDTGLGDGLKIGPTVGGRYFIRKSVFDIGFGVGDAKTLAASDDADSTGATKYDEGFDYSARINFTPVQGLKFGLGGEHVVNTKYLNDADDNYNNIFIADSSYNGAHWGYLVEYVTMNNNSNSGDTTKPTTETNLTAFYGELGCKIGKFQPYVGRAINLKENGSTNVIALMNKFTPTSGSTVMGVVCDNYTEAGLDYFIMPKTVLTAEYVSTNDFAGKNEYSFGLRLQVLF